MKISDIICPIVKNEKYLIEDADDFFLVVCISSLIVSNVVTSVSVKVKGIILIIIVETGS